MRRKGLYALVLSAIFIGMTAGSAAAMVFLLPMDTKVDSLENVENADVVITVSNGEFQFSLEYKFSSDYGCVAGAGLGVYYDNVSKLVVTSSRKLLWHQKNYNTWGPIDFTSIWYTHKSEWIGPVSIRMGPYAVIQISTSYHIVAVKHVHHKLFGKSYTRVLDNSTYTLSGFINSKVW